MNIIENTASVVSTNLGATPQQQADNGITIADPAVWTAKRYEFGEDVLIDGKVYRYVVNNNAIPRVNRGALDSEFETLDELIIRTGGMYELDDAGNKTYLGDSCNVNSSNNIGDLSLVCMGDSPNQGVGILTGTLTITGNNPELFTGELQFRNADGELKGVTASIVSGQGTSSVEWRLDNIVWDFADGSGTLYFTLPDDTPTGAGFVPSFTGTLRFNHIYAIQEPLRDNSRIASQWRFVNDINWWTLVRAGAVDSFFDEKPAVGIGRRGAVQVQVSSETPFDSVALVNCECLEAEVEGEFRGERLCGVSGADTNPSAIHAASLALVCDGETPTEGVARLGGVIRFTTDSSYNGGFRVIDDQVNISHIGIATQISGGSTGLQEWRFDGVPWDFTNTDERFLQLDRQGGAVFTPAVNDLTFTFDGELTDNPIFTQSPDAPHEPSDLLFTDLQPIANDAGIYTATINIKADDVVGIPTELEPADAKDSNGDYIRKVASIGQIVIGKKIVLGTTDANAISKSLLDFSTIERLPEGDFDVFKRHATYEINVRTQYPAADGQKVQRIIHALTPAKPAFFYVPDFSNYTTTGDIIELIKEEKPLGAGMYLYGIIELASFGVDSENEPSADAGEIVELKIGGLV